MLIIVIIIIFTIKIVLTGKPSDNFHRLFMFNYPMPLENSSYI